MGRKRSADYGRFRPEANLIQSSVVSAGLIAGKPAPTGISPAFRHALYLWEPRLPAMGREAAPIPVSLKVERTIYIGSKAVIYDRQQTTQAV